MIVSTGKGWDVSLYDVKIQKLHCQYPHSCACVGGLLPKRDSLSSLIVLRRGVSVPSCPLQSLHHHCDIVLTEPRSTSCETYQHSTNVTEHKAKVTHSAYSINSILRRGLQNEHVRLYQDSSILYSLQTGSPCGLFRDLLSNGAAWERESLQWSQPRSQGLSSYRPLRRLRGR